MNQKGELAKRFFIRLIIGAVPLSFFIMALFTKSQSGNNGMSVNLGKFVPVIFLLGWGIFLILEGLFLFSKQRVSNGLISISVASFLGIIFFISLYVEHSY
ncbi:MAG: hypothetical protein EOO86_05850 [Pedobacter sp.]|nr:MAG: hypothetical protein EOO86_05850 [Pedobacter sp.]